MKVVVAATVLHVTEKILKMIDWSMLENAMAEALVVVKEAALQRFS